MEKIEKYYENTTEAKPNYTVKRFIELNVKPGNAIELGCGAGRDTVYLIKNGWNVLAIDREEVKSKIEAKLTKEEMKKFNFLKQKFEDVKIEKNNLVVDNFKELWNKIKNGILKGGYFVGNFFGDNDEWKSTKEEMTFLTKEHVIKLFNDFEIIEFKEVEKDDLTGLGKIKHWHILNVIAKKL